MPQLQQLQRLHLILDYLFSLRRNVQAGAPEILSHLKKEHPACRELSMRQLQRDLNELVSLFGGVVKMAEAGRKRLYQIAENQEGDERTDILSSLLSRIYTSQLFEMALSKPADLQQHLSLEDTAPLKNIEMLPNLLEAIITRTVVSFNYHNWLKGTEREHTLHPYMLKEHKNRWYLLGYKPGKESYTMFGVDRIKPESLTILKEQFERNPDFNPAKFSEGRFGITWLTPADPEEIRLRFSTQMGRYIKSLPLHPSQMVLADNDEGTTIALKVTINDELIAEILKYGADVQVLLPQHLAQQIRKKLRKALKAYQE